MNTETNFSTGSHHVIVEYMRNKTYVHVLVDRLLLDNILCGQLQIWVACQDLDKHNRDLVIYDSINKNISEYNKESIEKTLDIILNDRWLVFTVEIPDEVVKNTEDFQIEVICCGIAIIFYELDSSELRNKKPIRFMIDSIFFEVMNIWVYFDIYEIFDCELMIFEEVMKPEDYIEIKMNNDNLLDFLERIEPLDRNKMALYKEYDNERMSMLESFHDEAKSIFETKEFVTVKIIDKYKPEIRNGKFARYGHDGINEEVHDAIIKKMKKIYKL